MWKHKALVFTSCSSITWLTKVTCPFWSIFVHYNLNLILSRDYNFFQSLSERLYFVCLGQVAEVNHSYVWPTLIFLISLLYLLVILLIVLAGSANISNGYNFAKISDIQTCDWMSRKHKNSRKAKVGLHYNSDWRECLKPTTFSKPVIS